MYFVYVLKSIPRKTLYTGQTDNIVRRLKEHNFGLLGQYTKSRGPWELIYFEVFDTRSEAMNREKFLKSGAGRNHLKNIIQSNPKLDWSLVQSA